MNALDVILLVIAAVCFALAAFGVSARINLVALGLFAWVLDVLLHALGVG
jgi:hypothetical protein